MTLEEIARAIRKIRDECNAFLAEVEVDQITRDQAAQIERDVAANRAKPKCVCGRDLLTQTELKVGTCHLCLTNDGTLLAEEQKYVPGSMV